MIPLLPTPRTLLLALPLLAAWTGQARAADVVLTDFTPASFDEFSVAEDLGHLARMALEDAGLVVLAGDDLNQRVGTIADTCADEPACPGNLWGRVDVARILVGRVEAEGALLRVTVEVYEDGGASPALIYEEVVPPAGAGEFLLRVAESVAPERGADPTVTRVSPGVVEESYEPIETERDRKPAPRLEQVEVEEPVELERYRLPLYVQRNFERSGLSVEDWLDEARIRTPAVFLELHGGAIMGDLDRRYDTRVAVYDEPNGAYSTRDVYTWETFLNGRGATGGVVLGYQATWWLDVGVFGGVQFGNKELSTGVEVWEEGGGSNGEDLLVISPDDVPQQVSAMLGVMEPRLRLYPLAMGPFKPYALIGFNLRFYDAYAVPDDPDTGTVYPTADGGIGFGPTLGGGLAIDANERFTGIIEVPWTYVVVPSGASTSGGTMLGTVPAQFRGVGQYICFKAGLGVAFR